VIKSFVRNTLAAFLGAALFFFFLLIVLTSMTAEEKIEVPDRAILVIDLSLPISDKPNARGASGAIEDTLLSLPVQTTTLLQVTDAIRNAAGDDRVVGIYLHGDITGLELSSGWATLKEVREELLRFRETGKKIFAYNMHYSEREYYLASAADRIAMHPAGILEFNGLETEILFYAGAFRKYGIGVQVTRAGEFKSAVEPYTLEKLSPAGREQVEDFLGDIFDEFLTAVSSSRKIPVETLRGIARTGLIDGRDVTETGLVDEAVSFDVILDEMMTFTGTGGEDRTFRQISLLDYSKSMEDASRSGDNRIALIYVEGDLVDGDSLIEAGGDTVARLLRAARTDDSVRAVVLRVNSPGGSAAAAEVILREVALTREKKPVVVSLGSTAASGGYWIACRADEIVAEPNTITGSIGVYGIFPNIGKLMNDLGLTVDTVRTAPQADIMSLYRPRTDDELALLRKLVERTYEEFLDNVAGGRDLKKETVRVIARGRVWSGRDALELGLVDTLGGLSDAVKSAARRAGLSEGYSLSCHQEERSFLEGVLDLFSRTRDNEVAQAGLVGREMGNILTVLRKLDNFNDPRGAYARMPWNLTIR
jgi:protease IV